MCVIINQPAGEAGLTKELAQKAFAHNPDGAGFAFYNPERARIKVRKYSNFENFWSTYVQDYTKYGEEADFLVHFRIATSGPVNKDNTHPFWVSEYTVMAHNGIFHDMPEDVEMSDTRLFIDKVINNFPRDWLDNPYLVKMVEEYMGWSKLAFITQDPLLKKENYILNEKGGSWHKGMWLSNKMGLGLDPPKAQVVNTQFAGGYNKAKMWDREAGKWADCEDTSVSGYRYGSLGSGVYDGYWEDDTYQIDDSKALSVALQRLHPDTQLEKAKALRKERGIDPDTLILDDGNTFCMGCETDATLNGWCFCQLFFCVKCKNMLPGCECKNFPSKLVLTDLGMAEWEIGDAMLTRYEFTKKRRFSELKEKKQKELLDSVVYALLGVDDRELAAKYYDLAFKLDVYVESKRPGVGSVPELVQG